MINLDLKNIQIWSLGEEIPLILISEDLHYIKNFEPAKQEKRIEIFICFEKKLFWQIRSSKILFPQEILTKISSSKLHKTFWKYDEVLALSKNLLEWIEEELIFLRKILNFCLKIITEIFICFDREEKFFFFSCFSFSHWEFFFNFFEFSEDVAFISFLNEN